MTSMGYKFMRHDVSVLENLIGWLTLLCVAHARLMQGAFDHVITRRHVEELVDTIMVGILSYAPFINCRFTWFSWFNGEL